MKVTKKCGEKPEKKANAQVISELKTGEAFAYNGGYFLKAYNGWIVDINDGQAFTHSMFLDACGAVVPLPNAEFVSGE